jgi:hypothetical protein
MKWKIIRLFCITTLLFAVLYACNKTDSDGSGHGRQVEFVRATLSGRITDDQQLPVSGASVKASTTTATTDADGFFTIKDIYVDRYATVVKVEKEGFFLGTKTIMVDVDRNNVISLQLITKQKAGDFSSTGGGNITVPGNGGKIEFTANSVVNPADNKPYTGNVNVSAFFINPAASNFREIMPGTLRGITVNNEETGLQSFGMMAVELNGDNGQKLQIAPGQKATLHFPITESLRGTAPATIPLWSLDEATGLWKEEGSATRQGDEYVGTVSHFSFWNCDAPFPIITFKVTVKTKQGVPLPNAEVVFSAGTSDTTSISANGYSNTEGEVTGSIPANKTLGVKIYDRCRNLLYNKNIGPFTAAADLGVITVDASPTLVTFSGTATSCGSAPVANGYVSIEMDGMFFNIPVTNGSFNKAIVRCGNAPVTANVTAYDTDNNVAGSPVSVAVSGNNVNIGALTACGTVLDTYIKYNFDGVNYSILPPRDTILVQTTTGASHFTFIGGIRGRDLMEEIVFIFKSENSAPGVLQLFVADVYRDNTFYYRNGSQTINITEYGPVPGGYITGTYSGTLKDSLNTKIVPMSCSFRVKIP